jgi:hypothetical protein
MADQTAQHGTPGYDECDEYDRRQGRTTDKDEQKPSGLTEAGNKPSPHPVSFKTTTSK